MIRDLRTVARLQEGERGRLSASIVLAFVAVLMAGGLMATSGYLLSRCAQISEILEVSAVVTIVRAIAISRALSRYGERLVSHDLALRVLARLRSSFYAVLAPLGKITLAGHGAGDLLSRFVADVDSLQDLYLRALAPPVVALMVIVTAGIGGAILLPAAGPVVAICLLITAIVVPTVTAILSVYAGRRQARARSALTSEMIESLDGAVELAVAGRARERATLITRLGRDLTRIARVDAAAGAAATTLTSLLTGATIIVVLLVGIPGVYHHHMGVVYLAALVLMTMSAFEGLDPLPKAARAIRGCSESATRLQELGSLTPAVQEPNPARELPSGFGVQVQDVSFSYPDGTNPLRGVSIEFPEECRIAIQGSSGAGKTTLAETLVRFIDPSAGRVLLDGVDIRELGLHDLRGVVAIATQDAHVFTSTVRENLLLANRDADEERLWDALRAVQLEEWVRSLPEGLDTMVGEDGEWLSGGQRQRLTIARVLVTDARVLILDEPTAQLDEDTAEDLMSAVIGAASGRSLIVISHRSEGLHALDRVVRFDDGQLMAV